MSWCFYCNTMAQGCQENNAQYFGTDYERMFLYRDFEAPPIEFDEKLRYAVVDKVTVYNDDRLVYSLKDGTEITIEL